jgi:hypothetical protein
MRLPLRRAVPADQGCAMSATARTVDLSFGVSLAWPTERWYEPQTFDQVAAQDAISGARAQGLADRIEDPSAVRQLASLLRTR